MEYTSSLIEKIITSTFARETLNQVSPIYADSRVGLWIFEVIGREVDGMRKWADELALQLVPQTATWALAYYEAEYGIPTDESIPISQRRDAILLKIRTRAPMNPVKLSEQLERVVHADVVITENTGVNTFMVTVSALPYMIDETILKRALDERKPAHLIYKVVYERSVSGNAFFGGIFAANREFLMKQVN